MSAVETRDNRREHDLDWYARELVKNWPPLTAEQRDTLATLPPPGGGSHDAT